MGQVLKVRNGGKPVQSDAAGGVEGGSKRAGRARAEARTRNAEPHASLYDEVTARIVAELEAGRFPWVQPWDSAVACPGLPRNAVTGRSYSGVNVLILWGEVIAKGYANQVWLTFRQALAAGGCVRKGERGVTVCYADRFTPEAEKERAKADGDEAKAVPFLKRFVVFNVAQCDGLARTFGGRFGDSAYGASPRRGRGAACRIRPRGRTVLPSGLSPSGR